MVATITVLLVLVCLCKKADVICDKATSSISTCDAMNLALLYMSINPSINQSNKQTQFLCYATKFSTVYITGTKKNKNM